MPDVARRAGSVTAWRGGWRVRLVVDGHRTSLGVHATRDEAERVLAAALEQTSDRRALTLHAWGQQWLDARELAQIRRRVDDDRSRWRCYVDGAPWAHDPMDALTSRALRAWVAALTARGLAEQTVRNALGVLRVALEAAVDAELIAANPARGVKVARRARTDEPWTWLRTPEIDALLDARMKDSTRSAIVVALYSGIRQGESWGLRWGDVELDESAPCLMVRRSYRGPTKGGKPRRVELLPPAAAALRTWRALRPGLPAALVWPGDGGGCHARGFDADLWAVLQRAGVRRVRWHDLRHTCASHLIQGTWGRAWSLTEIQQHLGHKRYTTTERYAHLAHDGLRAAAAATPGHTRDTGTRGGHGR